MRQTKWCYLEFLSLFIVMRRGGGNTFIRIFKIWVSLGFTKMTRSNENTSRIFNIILYMITFYKYFDHIWKHIFFKLVRLIRINLISSFTLGDQQSNRGNSELNGSNPTLSGSEPNLTRLYQDQAYSYQQQIARSREVKSIVAKRINDRRSRSSSGSDIASKVSTTLDPADSGKIVVKTSESSNSSHQEIYLDLLRTFLIYAFFHQVLCVVVLLYATWYSWKSS